ncbi:protein FAR1-related sequence 11, partial [Tanacetum coccineum]
MKEGLPFDLNEVPIDEDVFDSEGQIEEENVDEPFVGQCFLSEEEASVFYQKYTKISGFSVRKGRFENKKGENKGERKRRDFFCHREGKPRDKLVDYSKKQRNRVATRCECIAIMRIKLRKMNDIFSEEWHVTRFVSKHNHDLLSTHEPSYECYGA